MLGVLTTSSNLLLKQGEYTVQMPNVQMILIILEVRFFCWQWMHRNSWHQEVKRLRREMKQSLIAAFNKELISLTLRVEDIPVSYVLVQFSIHQQVGKHNTHPKVVM